MRTAPVQVGPDTCTYLNAIGYRRRLDGGYTIAPGTGLLVPLVPDSLRYLREYLPAIRKEAGLKPRLNSQTLRELSDRATGRSTSLAPSRGPACSTQSPTNA